MSIRLKHIVLGGVIASLHSIVVVILALYFGLGMSQSGTWFWQNIFSQPGYTIAKYYESAGYPSILLDCKLNLAPCYKL
jgi:hypothetical protein